MVDALNFAYLPLQIQFFYTGWPVKYIDNDSLFNDPSGAILETLQANDVQNTINIYFRENQTYCGVHREYEWYDEVKSHIAMRNNCSPPEDPSSLPHEVGHYFELFHTQDSGSGGPENVTRDDQDDCFNCDVAGDFLCDTRADPGLNPGNVDEEYCQYTGSATDACVRFGTPGDPYDPDTHNFMSYSLHDCRYHFSPGQQECAFASLWKTYGEALYKLSPEGADCDVNGTIDVCEFPGGAHEDCTDNGVPDACEPDCNANGVADSCDIAGGTSDDCNANYVPDECEIDISSPAPGGPFFCDPAAPPVGLDWCDPDCDNNGTPDECDIAGCLNDPTCNDCNSNSVPDGCDVASATSADCNSNAVPDECEPQDDCNENDVQDICDIADCNGSAWCSDCNQNGVLDGCLTMEGDCNDNEVPDECDISSGTSVDVDPADGYPDECWVIHVWAGTPSGGNGVSWETAFQSLDKALGRAGEWPGAIKEIWVAEGTYSPDPTGLLDPADATFQLVEGVHVYGGFAGTGDDPNHRSISGNVTTLSAEISPSVNAENVVTASGTSPLTKLDGFVIKGARHLGGSSRGIMCYECSTEIWNCIITGNERTSGGGIFISGEPLIINTTFVHNSGGDYAGGAFVSGGEPEFVNCTFTDNFPLQIYVAALAQLRMSNCIVWENSNPIVGNGPTDIRYSCINRIGEDPWPGIGNINADPLFADPAAADLRLTPGSLCIDAADNAALPEDVDTDLDGKPRFVDDPSTPDCQPPAPVGGCGIPPIVDMGAYEFCPLLSPTQASPPHDARKNRYISISPGTTCGETALQVKLVSMKRCSGDLARSCEANECEGGGDPGAPCSSDLDCSPGGTCKTDCGVCDSNNTIQCSDDLHCAGGSCVPSACVELYGTQPLELGWVSEPYDASCFTEDGTSTGDPCTDKFIARVVADPVYRLWAETTVHVGDCEIVPVAEYEIRATPDEVVFSDPLEIGTIQKPGTWHYGDTVGVGTGALPPQLGFTPPDGVVNVTDVQAFIQTIEGSSSPSAPVTWVDLHGLGVKSCSVSPTPCSVNQDCPSGQSCIFPPGIPPNYILNVSDLQRILWGLERDTWLDNPERVNPGCCPTAQNPDPCGVSSGGGGGMAATFTLVPTTDIISSAESVDVDVYVDSVDDLGAFELDLEVTGGTSGQLTLASITVDSARQDYVFFGEVSTHSGVNTDKGSFSHALQGDGVPVTGSGYLATYTYQPVGGASGVFTITVKGGEASFLNKGNGVMVPTLTGATQVIGVGIDCFDAADCAEFSCQTPTCNNYACIYTNLAQGTPCDDGQYCTETDECDGNGTCVGSGTPCPPPRNPQCCEGTDQCICSTCMCPQ